MIYNIKVKDSNYMMSSLETYKGKVMLIVNTATKCGFTKQYEGLQLLYEKYEDKGFVILDFPCNQFLMQAPGSVADIKSFCELNYHTTFPLFDKIKVNGFFAHPLYRYLKSNSPQEFGPGQTEVLQSKKLKTKEIKWNFTKFLIDRDGTILYRFSPQVTPEEIEKFVVKIL
ncbi:glutathione peroxidase [Acholeplasma hippikon]|uniref:Glutathione peroxidase n=1 Tax=Acholeplasma hippikon TaxID=264636 RepID=A0A449BIX2_9MOLU|nr:glutathione peroxidase [Acholeplasma hippikon]VEU82353.1 Glutathione peroxidase homolog BsaA [Acholeplasma hippikon]